MTRSIRTRLLLWMIGGMALLMAVFAVVVYEVMHRSLLDGFDEVLVATTRTICGFVEQDDQEIKVETDERDLPEFYRSVRPSYFQVWTQEGETVSRSPSLEEADLERFEGPLDSFVFRPVRLPDGRRGRAVSLFFGPKIDDEAGDVPTPRKVLIVVARETGALDSEIAFLQTLLWSASGGSIILALLMGVVVVHHGLRPLRSLASGIASIREDDLSVRIPIAPMPAEMIPVAQRLNELLHRLEDAFHRERTFTADAAHELRTPLAGLRSVIEVALARPRTSEDYQQAMIECLEIVRHTQSMIDNLLALARLDNGQTTLRPETLCLSEVIDTAWRPLAGKTQARGLSVDTRVPTDLSLRTDRDNLALTLTVLLTNAVEYSDDDGQIKIAARQIGDLVELTVANSACKLSEDAAQHVFERFWRADASRTNTGIHCGLGLAIAKRIVTSLGGTIAASVSGNNFVVRVILPASPA